MNEIKPETGRLVRSTQGRDKGKWFIITGDAGNGCVWIANGTSRKIAIPKKKKLRHLEMKPVVLSAIAEKIADGRKVFDAEVASAINQTEYLKEQEAAFVKE